MFDQGTNYVKIIQENTQQNQGTNRLTLTACRTAGLIVDKRFSWANTSKILGLPVSLTPPDVKCAPCSAIVEILSALSVSQIARVVHSFPYAMWHWLSSLSTAFYSIYSQSFLIQILPYALMSSCSASSLLVFLCRSFLVYSHCYDIF